LQLGVTPKRTWSAKPQFRSQTTTGLSFSSKRHSEAYRKMLESQFASMMKAEELERDSQLDWLKTLQKREVRRQELKQKMENEMRSFFENKIEIEG
jgi:hypothetical protein